ncbi:MAG: DUF1351 domain-containing protein [Butyrivibrio sp.]|nr:DUF1351 domain-containing protein [Acetatifactor muris]MCM1561453.1 DUF1351 domain-containing protein [Butyrivibrio sp.]
MGNYEVKVIPTAGSVTCDFEGAKAYLKEQLSIYGGMVFTEDTKKAAKETVAELRKQKKAFSDRVKEVRNEYMRPFEQFSAQAQELYLLYDEPISFISGQVEEFEKKRIEEKKVLIRETYAELMTGMEEVLPLERIYNPKWENATTTQKAIRAELMERKEAAKQAIATIKEMGSDVEDIALQMYKDTYDLQKCILYITGHEKQKQEILAREQERIRREEEERIRREEREKLEAERRAEDELRRVREQAEAEKQEAIAAAEEQKEAAINAALAAIDAIEQAKAEAAQEVIESFIPDSDGEENLYEYRISLTADGKEKLETYMDSVGIEWELI